MLPLGFGCDVGTSMYLRVDPPEKETKQVNWAEEYQLEKQWPIEGNESSNGTVSAVIERLRQEAESVFISSESEERRTVFVGNSAGDATKVCIEMAWQVGDRIRSTLSGEADHYLIYCKGLEKIYSVHGDEFDESVSLRIGGCSENSSRAKLADDYSLENNWPPAVNPSGTTSATQLASKTVDTVETDGYTAEVPSDCDDGRTIIATREESELRLRAESAWLENGLLRFNVTAPADLYVIEHPEESEIYMIPDDAFESSISLRVEPPEKSSPRINYAEDFLFEKRWPPQEASG